MMSSSSDGYPKSKKRLPALKPPALSDVDDVDDVDSAFLIACSSTGRASWAGFRTQKGPWSDEKGFEWSSIARWTLNIPAIPDLNATPEQHAAVVPSLQYTPTGPADWTGHSCGVCGSASTQVPGFESTTMWACQGCNHFTCPGGFTRSPADRKVWQYRCLHCGMLMSVREHQQVKYDPIPCGYVSFTNGTPFPCRLRRSDHDARGTFRQNEHKPESVQAATRQGARRTPGVPGAQDNNREVERHR